MGGWGLFAGCARAVGRRTAGRPGVCPGGRGRREPGSACERAAPGGLASFGNCVSQGCVHAACKRRSTARTQASTDSKPTVCWKQDFSYSSDGKESACDTGDPGSLPGWGRSPGGGHGNPLQYSDLENPMYRGARGLLSPTDSDTTERLNIAQHNPEGFPGGSDSKASACNTGEPGSVPGSGRSPGEGNDSPLQYSCLGNPMDRGV